MILGFKSEYIQEYKILRDYYVSDGELHGIQFILCNSESGEVKQFFLDKKYLSDIYIWEKSKKEEADYLAYGIEKGEATKLIIETGHITMKKRFSKDQTVSQTAKKYRFIFA